MEILGPAGIPARFRRNFGDGLGARMSIAGFLRKIGFGFGIGFAAGILGCSENSPGETESSSGVSPSQVTTVSETGGASQLRGWESDPEVQALATLLGKPAPDFGALPVILPVSDGKTPQNAVDGKSTIRLADFPQDVVVLAFLSTSCPTVLAYESRMITFVHDQDRNRNRDAASGKVGFLAVASSPFPTDSLPALKAHAHGSGYPFPLASDPDQKARRLYRIQRTPTFLVLDKHRIIRYVGAWDDNANKNKVTQSYVDDVVTALLAGQAPTLSQTPVRGLMLPQP